jgi:ubiquinone/menaquinone biosynthesis C-methylase UbiE
VSDWLNLPVVEHRDVAHLDEDAWYQRHLASVESPVLDGRRYPGFPDESTQKAFVGSAYGAALDEGARFYRYVRAETDARRTRLSGGRYLDFGAGWGRIGRFFLRDFERGDMAGVDVDPSMVAFCREAAVPGHHLTVQQGRPLPFANGAFRLITAYSVFTHLPRPIFEAWMDELLRVTAPGGLIVFTVEPERFLDFVAGIDPSAPESGWHAALYATLGDLETRRRALRADGYTYLATGGGAFRGPEVYGDTVVTPGFVADVVRRNGELLSYVDDPSRFWQAVAVVRRSYWRFRPRRGGPR